MVQNKYSWWSCDLILASWNAWSQIVIRIVTHQILQKIVYGLGNNIWDTDSFVWTKKGDKHEKPEHTSYTALLLSLAACAPKNTMSVSTVGASSVKKSSDKAKRKEQSEETKSDEHDKEAIGTLSMTKRISMKTVRLWPIHFGCSQLSTRELNNDHGAVDGYPQDMFIDYYNTYTGDPIICRNIIDKLDAEKKHRTQSAVFHKDKLIQLTNEKETADLFKPKRRGLLGLFLAVVKLHRWKSLHRMNGDQWRFSWSDATIKELLNHTGVFVLKLTTRTTADWDA